MEPLIGQVFCDRYQIQSLLGRQTGRRTFLAHDLQQQKTVVVKLLLFNPDFTWEDLKLFEREAEVLKSLDHPAIPKYLDGFEVETDLGKGFALVQTYLEAQSLQQWIQTGRTFSETELKAIAKDLLNILDYLHCRQPAVVHRDIKPSNILLGDRSGNQPGQLYLIDFGSVQTAAPTGTRTIVGTYGYMPPEQFGGQTTPASDLYAVGATLIHLATGRSPDQLPQKDMRLEFKDQVNLDSRFVDWLQWMTEPSVDRRLSSAKQALAALENSQASSLARSSKPLGSKVHLTQTRQKIEIVIPPQGFHIGLIPVAGFAIAWNSFLVMWYSIALSSWSTGGWFIALFAIGHLGIGLSMIWNILFTLFGRVKLRITDSEISQSWEILGVNIPRHRSADRRDIGKLELTQLAFAKDSEGGRVEVPPQINIWAGTKKYVLSPANRLTILELRWLAEQLSDWLNLPVTREPQ